MSQREKRKLHDDHGHHNLVVSSTTQKKVRDAHVTDDEVEEFYTILRRINAAAQYFKSGSDKKEDGMAAHVGGEHFWRKRL